MLALVVTVGRADAELASDELWSLGVIAIEERYDTETGVVELWTSLGDDVETVAMSLSGLDHEWSWRFEAVDERVSETWREHAVPTWVTHRLMVYPAWQRRPDVGDVVAIAIEPGATFGMGDHPTTVLSMRALQASVAPGVTVLDVGCGSGVLAIAACLFGASYSDAIDISPAAVPTTRDNAVRNGVADRVRVSTTPLREVDGRYDVVVANILAPALIELAADLKRVLAIGGQLIVSGILADRHAHVLRSLAPLNQVARDDLGGWTAITLGA